MGVKPGDVLLRVNDETVLGRHHHEVVEMFAQVCAHDFFTNSGLL